MAEGVAKKFGIEAESAGTNPSKKIDANAIEVMREIRIDISNQIPKLLTQKMVEEGNLIITMGCIDSCPLTPPQKTIDWNIENPLGKDIEFFRMIKDEIRENLRKSNFNQIISSPYSK